MIVFHLCRCRRSSPAASLGEQSPLAHTCGMCFLIRCVTSPHGVMLSTACASAILQHCEWRHALSLLMVACHSLARAAVALCLAHSCSQFICAACKVLQGHANQSQADATSLPRA